MRLARVGDIGAESPVISGADNAWRDLRSVTEDIDGPFLRDGLEKARARLERGTLPVVDLGSTRFAAPIKSPGKIVCVGLNYRDHASETNAPIPEEPILFLKAADTIVGPNDPVLIPRNSTKTDWEVELGVVIGTEARYLASEFEAAEAIAGYVLSHDVSEREFQLERGGQWDKGKNCETFNPLGPWVLTRDEVRDPQNLGLRLSVNGRPRQVSRTDQMIFHVYELVRYISQFMVLRPGDVINTGTPAGVALGLADQPYLRPGDVVELGIDGLGYQRQVFEQG